MKADPGWSKPGRKPTPLLGGELYIPPDLVGGDRVVYFFERYLTHVKGELAGTPLALARWQKRDILQPLFSVRKDGLRKYRTCYVEIPRKNSKSTIGSGIALYMLLADGEPGAEIVSAASDRDQARIVFDIARSMVEASAELKRLCTIYRYEIVVPATGSRYRAISSEAYSKHGMNLHAAIIDEVHAHQDGGELWSVLTKGMGSRRQPLTFAITTAGYDRTETSLCWSLHEHTQRQHAGLLDDPTFLGVIYAAPPEADWKDPKVWAKANPGLGSSVKREYLAQECRRAQDMPVYENEFRRYHLNQWTESARAWVPMEAWDRGQAPVDLEALRGRVCYGGLDMATNTDLAALVLVFPQEASGYDVLAYAWCPRIGVKRRAQHDHAPYDVWAREGHLAVTEGDAVDQEAVREKILELQARYDIQELGYDEWNMGYLGPKLQADGLTLVPIRQTFKALSGATKHLERAILTGGIRHGGHPVLRWCLANTVVDTDGPENVKPSKKHSTERIDLTVALVMALDRAMRNAHPAWTGAALVL